MTDRTKKVINYSIYVGSGDDSDFDVTPHKVPKVKIKRKSKYSSEDTDFAEDSDVKSKINESKETSKKRETFKSKESKILKKSVVDHPSDQATNKSSELIINQCSSLIVNKSIELILNKNSETQSKTEDNILMNTLTEQCEILNPMQLNSNYGDRIKISKVEVKRINNKSKESKKVHKAVVDHSSDSAANKSSEITINQCSKLSEERVILKPKQLKSTYEDSIKVPKVEVPSALLTATPIIREVSSAKDYNINQSKMVTSHLRIGLSRKQRIVAPLHSTQSYK